MSRNDQLLVKEHKGRFYVFEVMAESWADGKNGNELHTSNAEGVFDTREKAHTFAHKLDSEDPWGSSEYGVVDEVLYKDGASVVIVDREKS